CDAASHCWSFCCPLGAVGIAVLLATARPEAGPDVQGDSGEKDQGGGVHVEQGDQDDTTQEAQGEEYGMAHEHPHVSIPRRTTARTARTPRVRATARIWVPAPTSRTPSADAGGLRTPATPTAHRTSPSQRQSAARPRAGTRAAIGGTRATPRRPGTGPSHGLRRARDHLDGHLDALGGEVDELPRQLADDGVGHHDAEGREDDRPGPVAALALERSAEHTSELQSRENLA